MKLLFDQNVSRRLVQVLATEFADSAHVAELGLAEADDHTIWRYAGEHGFVLVSKDNDFRQLAFLHGPPPKVVWLRVGNVATKEIEVLLRRGAEAIAAFVAAPEESLLLLG